VKLRQFDLDDQEQFSLLLDSPIPDSGHDEVILHSYQNERVRELVAAPGTQVALGDPSEVEELLVLEGSDAMGESSYPRWSWLRMPVGASATLEVVEPLRALVKTRPVYRET
jgi:hypothetical protein